MSEILKTENLLAWRKKSYDMISSEITLFRITMSDLAHLLDETAIALLAFDDDPAIINRLLLARHLLPDDIRQMLDNDHGV